MAERLLSGEVFRAWGVVCSGCGTGRMVKEKLLAAAMEVLRRRGWRKHADYGFRCPRCVARSAEGGWE